MQAVLGMASGPLGATVADRIPESRLGTVSAISGLGNLVGGLMGAVIAGAAFASLGLNLYFLFAGFIIVGVVGFVLLVKDRPSTALRVSPQSWRGFFRGFLTPLLDGDFRWVWIARVILFFGYANSTALSFYMLQSYITPALSAAEATRLAPMLTLAGVPGTVLAVAFAGRLSDKLGRRKPFVIAASLLMTVAMAVPLLSPTLIALYINAILIGIALGIYLPVDQALLIDVLPDKNAAGRDLGIGALGINIGQALGPILAAQVVALTGSYGLVWGAALVLTLGAAVVILPIKRVR
jgi:MFS family permease